MTIESTQAIAFLMAGMYYYAYDMKEKAPQLSFLFKFIALLIGLGLIFYSNMPTGMQVIATTLIAIPIALQFYFMVIGLTFSQMVNLKKDKSTKAKWSELDD